METSRGAFQFYPDAQRPLRFLAMKTSFIVSTAFVISGALVPLFAAPKSAPRAEKPPAAAKAVHGWLDWRGPDQTGVTH